MKNNEIFMKKSEKSKKFEINKKNNSRKIKNDFEINNKK